MRKINAVLFCLPLFLLFACGDGTASSGLAQGETIQSLPENSTSTITATASGHTAATSAATDETRDLPASDSGYGRLPAIYLTTGSGKAVTSKTEYVSGTFALRIGEGALYDPALSVDETAMQIRGRGHSSWEWPKKPYRIKLDKKASLFGLPKAKDWILKASYSDKTLLRDHIASVMGQKLNHMDYVPRTALTDVYLNNAYQGVYILSECIEIETGRLELAQGLEEDTGFIIEIGGLEEGDLVGIDYFNTESFALACVKSPGLSKRTTAQMRYITDYVKTADAAVIALDGYETYIDIPSLIDWFILHELTYNLDSSFRRSCYMTKDAGGKLKMGPPWDFDLAFGNHFRYNNYPNVWASVSREDGYVGVTWMDHLLKDPQFTSQLKARWNTVGNSLLKTALDEINLYEKVIDKSQRENFKTWDIMGGKVGFEPGNIAAIKTYAGKLEQMRNFLVARKAWMDRQIAAFS